MSKEQKVEAFKNDLFALQTRRFGEAMEIITKKLLDLEDSDTLEYDKVKNSKRIEIKASRALAPNAEKINEDNFLESIKQASMVSRVVNSDDDNWQVQIQQVKPHCFDEMIYIVAFNDKLEFFKMTSQQVEELEGYSDKQHRGNEGEGQFTLKNSNIDKHREKYKILEKTYEEIYDLFDSPTERLNEGENNENKRP